MQAPFTSVIAPPDCPLQSQWTLCDTLIRSRYMTDQHFLQHLVHERTKLRVQDVWAIGWVACGGWAWAQEVVGGERRCKGSHLQVWRDFHTSLHLPPCGRWSQQPPSPSFFNLRNLGHFLLGLPCLCVPSSSEGGECIPHLALLRVGWSGGDDPCGVSQEAGLGSYHNPHWETKETKIRRSKRNRMASAMHDLESAPTYVKRWDRNKWDTSAKTRYPQFHCSHDRCSKGVRAYWACNPNKCLRSAHWKANFIKVLHSIIFLRKSRIAKVSFSCNLINEHPFNPYIVG